jgi:uncharacterized protein YcfJ
MDFRQRYQLGLSSCCLTFLLAAAGCVSGSHAQQGAVTGTALGTLAGAIIGHQSGHAAGGALIGAGTGAAAGAILGDAEDARDERDAAMRQIQHARHVRESQRLDNDDLIRMANSGLGDEVTINAVKTRGGRFDLSPDGLIRLKSEGVSDQVIQAVEREPTADDASFSKTVPVKPSSVKSVVVVEPRPSVGISFGLPRRRPIFFRSHHHGHGWRRHH